MAIINTQPFSDTFVNSPQWSLFLQAMQGSQIIADEIQKFINKYGSNGTITLGVAGGGTYTNVGTKTDSAGNTTYNATIVIDPKLFAMDAIATHNMFAPSLASLVTILGHELGHAVDTGGTGDVTTASSPDQAASIGARFEGVAVVEEYDVAIQLDPQDNIMFDATLEQHLKNIPSTDPNLYNDQVTLATNEYKTHKISFAPNLRYIDYYSDVWILKKYAISSAQVDWKKQPNNISYSVTTGGWNIPSATVYLKDGSTRTIGGFIPSSGTSSMTESYFSAGATDASTTAAFTTNGIDISNGTGAASSSFSPEIIQDNATITFEDGTVSDINAATIIGTGNTILMGANDKVTLLSAADALLDYGDNSYTEDTPNVINDVIQAASTTADLTSDTIIFEGQSLTGTYNSWDTDQYGRTFNLSNGNLTITKDQDSITINGFQNGDYGVIINSPYSYSSFNKANAYIVSSNGINDSGQTVGTYGTDSSYYNTGFLNNNGTFTDISVSGALSTDANGINNAGQIVGDFFTGDTIDSEHGFLYSGGVYTIINAPNALYTKASGINNAGTIVGTYNDDNGSHGFVDVSGTFTTIDVPDGIGSTTATAINNSNQVVGTYYDSLGNQHGFLDSNGVFTTIDFPLELDPNRPNLNPSSPMISINLTGINNSGQISGFIEDGVEAFIGFVYDSNTGSFTPITAPNNPYEYFVGGISNNGLVTGTDVVHSTGFVATPTINSSAAHNQITDHSDGNKTIASDQNAIISGDGNIITGSSGDSIFVYGNNNTITADINSNVTLNGSSNTVSAANGDTVNTSGSGSANTINVSGGTVNAADGTAFHLTGSNNSINAGSDDSAVVTGNNNILTADASATVSASGTGNVITVGENSTVTVASSASATVGTTESGAKLADATLSFSNTTEVITYADPVAIQVASGGQAVITGEDGIMTVDNQYNGSTDIKNIINWNDGTSQLQLFSNLPSGESEEVTNYSGANLTGTVTSEIIYYNNNSGPNSAAVSGIGAKVNASYIAVTLASNTSATLTGIADTAALVGNDTLSVNGTQNTVSVSGTDNVLNLSSGTMTMSANAGVTLSGSDDVVTANNYGNLYAYGTANTISMGTSSYLYVSTASLNSGDADTVSLSNGWVDVADNSAVNFTGSDTNVSTYGSAVLSVSGNSNEVDVYADNTVTVTGNSNTINSFGNTNDTFTITGNDNAVLAGTRNLINISGNGNSVTGYVDYGVDILTSAITFDGVDTRGNITLGTALPNGLTYTLSGTTLTVTKGSDSLAIDNFQNYDYGINISSSSTIYDTSSATISIANSATAAVIGDYDTITAGTSATLLLDGLGDTLTAGNGSTVNIQSNGQGADASDYDTINLSHGTVNVADNAAINLYGSDNTVVTGINDNVYAYGDRNTITFGAGSYLYLSSDSTNPADADTVTLSDGWVDIEGNSAVTVHCANTNVSTYGSAVVSVIGNGNEIDTSADNTVTVAGNNNVINAYGSASISLSGTNNTLHAHNGDIVTLATGASATITGANLTIHGNGNHYQFARGAGHDALINGLSTNTGPSGELDMGANISKNQIWFEHVGNNLQVDILGTTDHMTINNWYSNSYSKLSSIHTAAGNVIDSQLQQLVQAMATYSANHTGFNPTTATSMPTDSTLQSTLAASWH
ncbi:MAG TPA: hypothetical protein VFT64_12245 [Rickettsiales bacterium]|nr:hypothetical protein [Rickettsiales bacterium]